MMKKQGEDYEELKKLNADLEDKFVEMASTIAGIKCSLSGQMLKKKMKMKMMIRWRVCWRIFPRCLSFWYF
ncbi:hypothetical protein D8674_019658 [Pyrus ussuriensis x Pyrus communis]|uniref:Uncharacterized protein n=1 Tax=Pyrus ussuriensis x Pyrus communis TaxID=2448454 RepID=A0A5N5G8E1_9ROSA|nr:hypothetical protein D8674_019658 [Pyrus ussuriensis x Pyrus communis]